MATPGRSAPPPKPWERAGAAAGSSGPSPFAPASNTGSTAAAVTSAGTATTEAQKEEVARNTQNVAGSTVGRPMPPRPWETNSSTGYGTSGYGTGTMNTYNRGGYGGYGSGSGTYGSSYGGYGGSSMYGGSGYGGSMYGSGGYGGSMYGGGMYGNRVGGYGGMGMGGGMGGYGMGGGMGGYGMGGMGGYGMGGMPGDPNNPNGPPPPQAPGFWISMLNGLQGVMHFFGRLSILVDENTQAFHFFITALLQLCDRAGVLYGELARFVLRLLGFRTGAKARARSKAAARALEGGDIHPGQQPGQEMMVKPSAPEPAWDNVWPENGPTS
ncbi:hypothetical protein R1sor_013765 [Riccia sorocarpa]|uniref:Peroxin-13 n=1 Tax=Riccia sorocarpa TaxID=122646 RepID=A0ABD3H9E1_9MARC